MIDIVIGVLLVLGMGIFLAGQLVRDHCHKPDYKKIHALEYELGFREDPLPGTPAWWCEHQSGAVGLWQIPPQRKPTLATPQSPDLMRAIRDVIEGDIGGRGHRDWPRA